MPRPCELSNLRPSFLDRHLKPDAPPPAVHLESAPHYFEESRHLMLIQGASVPIHAAAELANVEVRAIRQWAATGALAIESRGDMEVVRLDKVKALSATPSRRSPSQHGEALRGRMAGETTETLSVARPARKSSRPGASVSQNRALRMTDAAAYLQVSPQRVAQMRQ
jgi:hypothetical protein